MKSLFINRAAAVFAALAFAGAINASAQVINGSFESPAGTSDNVNTDASNTIITGWTATLYDGDGPQPGSGYTGLAYLPGNQSFDGITGGTGNQAAVLNEYYGYHAANLTSGIVSQVAANTEYKLSIDAGIPTGADGGTTNTDQNGPVADASTFTLELVDSSGAIFASSQAFNFSSLTVGQFANFTLDYTSGATPSDLGEGLQIVIYDQNSYQDNHSALDIDNVTLTAPTVPEPSTYAMLMAGFGALVFLVRRKLA